MAIVVDSVCVSRLNGFLQAIPKEALVEDDFRIIIRAQQRYSGSFLRSRHTMIPDEFWQRRDFILKWTEQKKMVPLHLVPTAFREDQEICLALSVLVENCREVCEWISESLLSDKDFVLPCLSYNPRMFEYCSSGLQSDFDVLLETAFGAASLNIFSDFIQYRPKSFADFIKAIRGRLEARDQFTTFLACSWKSRQLSQPPLCILDCDKETARGLKTMIAKYLGFSNAKQGVRLNLVMDEIVLQVVMRTTLATGLRSTTLVQLLDPHALARGVLKTIKWRLPVLVHNFPDELWTSRDFGEWAARQGMFQKAIPEKFSSDEEICVLYYQYCPADREEILLSISESLKSNRAFVLKCASIDPLVLSYCTKDDIRNDFEVVLKSVCCALRSDQLDDLVEAALERGWANSLVVFAAALRAKIEAHWAYEAFVEESRAHLFNCSAAVKETIGCYLGIMPLGNEFIELQLVWRDRLMFHLALGGSIEELGKACKFRAKKRRREPSRTTYECYDDHGDCYYGDHRGDY